MAVSFSDQEVNLYIRLMERDFKQYYVTKCEEAGKTLDRIIVFEGWVIENLAKQRIAIEKLYGDPLRLILDENGNVREPTESSYEREEKERLEREKAARRQTRNAQG